MTLCEGSPEKIHPTKGSRKGAQNKLVVQRFNIDVVIVDLNAGDWGCRLTRLRTLYRRD